jgi:hypothetical protein
VRVHVELRREAVLERGARGIHARQGLGKVLQQGGPAGRQGGRRAIADAPER